MTPLACPFCNSENVKLGCCASQWFVDCLACGATGPSITDGDKDDSSKAVEQWNAVPRQKPGNEPGMTDGAARKIAIENGVADELLNDVPEIVVAIQAAANLKPGEASAGYLIDAWINTYNKAIPWDKCCKIVAICTKMPKAELDRLLDMQ